MQPLQNCIGPTIHIGQGIFCLPYAVILNYVRDLEVSFCKPFLCLISSSLRNDNALNVSCFCFTRSLHYSDKRHNRSPMQHISEVKENYLQWETG